MSVYDKYDIKMKAPTAILLLALATFLRIHAQQAGGKPIQVATNEYTTTTFFFPSAIEKTINPSGNYNFEYQSEEPSIGYLKGKKGSSSNLTVITENGYIYSFAISYSENIGIFNFILTPDRAVGRIPGKSPGSAERATTPATQNMPTSQNRQTSHSTKASHNPQTGGAAPATNSTQSMATKPLSEEPPEKGKPTKNKVGRVNSSDSISEGSLEGSDVENTTTEDSDLTSGSDFTTYSDSSQDYSSSEPLYDSSIADDGTGDLYNIDREEYYRIFCENNYLQKTIFKRTFRQNKRVVLKLNNILVDQKEIYFVLQVENNSKKEYSVNGLSFFRKSGVGELQKIMKPLYVFNLQESIDPQSINEVVFIFDRFKLSNKEEVYVVLDEKDSNRMVMLPLDNKQINYPTN